MSALGRGLASLIPRRNKENAENMLEKIDSMEELDSKDTPTTRSLEVESEDEADTETPEKADEAADKKQLNVVEEFEDLEELENAPMPAKPLVTPLTIDPETGFVRATTSQEVTRVASVAADATKQAPAVKKTAAAKTTRITVEEKTEDVVEETVAPVSAEIPADDVMDAAIWDRHEDRVEQVPVGDIEVNAFQPRRNFDPEEMQELVQSIEQHGILQPLVVLRKTGGGFELIAGERRLRAAKKLGWEKVPCVVRTDVKTERNRLEMALIENIQRQNLNPIEEALGYQRLNQEFGMSHEEIGGRVGRSRVGITNSMRVLQLPAEIQRGLADGKITGGHARAILMIPDDEKQIKFYNHLLDEGLTVRKAEMRARRIQRQMNLNDPMRKKTRGRPQLALKYDGPLEEKFGFNARIKFIEEKNRFEVTFQAFSEAEAEELVGRLMGTTALPKNVDEDVIGDDADTE